MGGYCHVSDICKKSSRKINALARVSPYDRDKGCILMNSFFKSQFECCPLIWIVLETIVK